MVDFKITSKKSASFYVHAIKSFFAGTDEREARDELSISALGNAIGGAVSAATRVEADGVAQIVHVHTDYVKMELGTTAQIVIRLHKCGGASAQSTSSGAALANAGSHAMQGDRSYMEDRVVATSLAGNPFIAVYDGHVGEKAAEFCKAKLHDILASKLKTCAGDYDAALRESFGETNEQFIGQSGDDTSGTTACVAMLVDGTLHVANAGDARCVVFGSDGPCQISVDHKPDDSTEYARIEAAGGELFDAEDGVGSRVCGPNGAMLSCSRSIGDRHFKPMVTCEPDTFKHKVAGGDKFAIVATDGVWDTISNLKACNLVAGKLESGSAEDAAKILCEEALKAGSEDNISAVVLKLNA